MPACKDMLLSWHIKFRTPSRAWSWFPSHFAIQITCSDCLLWRIRLWLNWQLNLCISWPHLSACPFLCQAAVTIQDSCYEVQRLLLQESGRPSPRVQRPHLPNIRSNTLQEQEKQRNLEKQKEEVAEAQRLQERLRQEKERWERECQARESQQGEQESKLEERERQCHLEAERLRREREELDEQLEEYQQSLERLREGQRNVEREREQLENQQKLLQSWRHSRQRSLPAVIPPMVIPLDGQQVGVAHNRQLFLLSIDIKITPDG